MENKYISVLEILMGRAKLEELPKEYVENINILVTRVNSLLELFFKDHPNEEKKTVSSGYRTPDINKSIPGSAKKSNHMTCSAVDLFDKNRTLSNWCVKNIKKLNELELYLEDPKYTPSWTHLQIKKTRNNPFIP